jgi:hypothetical protein
MGTNYYCENSTDRAAYDGMTELTDLHIGKSSAGWCFMLHVIPELGLNSLEDWKKLLNQDTWNVRDEYGNPSLDIEEIITKRAWERVGPLDPDFHRHNYSEAGPNGLVRFRLDAPGCVGHGEGTWDLIEGDFS